MSAQQAPSQEPFSVDEPIDAPASGAALSDNERLLGGLSYVSQIVIPALLPVILLVSQETKRSPFLRYHAVQSLALLVASVLYYLAALLVNVLVSAIASCLVCVLWMLYLFPIALLLYCGWKSFRGEYVEIPWLTSFLKDSGLL